MTLTLSAVPAGEYAVSAPEIDPSQLGRTHRVLLDVLRAVQDVQDEEDLQCLVFLADECGFLRPDPFCFGISLSSGARLPWSLILRDTLEQLRVAGLVIDEGCLRPAPHYRPSGTIAPDGLAWLASLPASERRTLAGGALPLRFGEVRSA
jgi:hypothetical protein